MLFRMFYNIMFFDLFCALRNLVWLTAGGTELMSVGVRGLVKRTSLPDHSKESWLTLKSQNIIMGTTTSSPVPTVSSYGETLGTANGFRKS